MTGATMRRMSIALALSTLLAAAAYAQQKPAYTPPKTAWGDPDLIGIWPSTDMVGVPFERPENLGERNEVTQEEFDARLKQQTTREEADAETTVSTAPRQGDGTGPPSHWLEWGKASKQASLLVEPRGNVEEHLRHVRWLLRFKRARSIRSLHLTRSPRLGVSGHLQQRQSDLPVPRLRRHSLRDDSRGARRAARWTRACRLEDPVLHG